MNPRKRYAIIGAGNRALSYIDALASAHREQGELALICDPSPTRMAWHNQRLSDKWSLAPVPTAAPAQLEPSLREYRIDTVIVTTPDYLHHEFVVRAMRAGCDVICEKPLAIDAPKLREIFNAVDETRRSLRVTFNARYLPEAEAVKKLIAAGTIGTVQSVDLQWVLDTSHGADYFRRWHREKDKSGGLLVHKASHHFDLINWWVASRPQRVFAFGDLKFYGRKAAEARGEKYDYDRYTDARDAKNDPFAISIDSDESMRGLYRSAERDTGYVRDRNVFGDNITIEDTIALTARYRSGTILSYSLLAYSPWEGFRVSLTGSKGRIELYDKHSAHILNVPAGDEAKAEQARAIDRKLTVYPMFGVPYDVPIETLTGSHWGSDALLLSDMFSTDATPDSLGRVASHIEGAAASLMGICANESIATGLPVDCDKVLKLP